MNKECPSCEQPEQLLWYTSGALNDEERSRVQAALESCPSCRALVEENALLAQAVGSAKKPLESTSPSKDLSPEELVAVAHREPDPSVLERLTRSDRQIIEVLRKVDAEIESQDRAGAASAPGLVERLRAGWASLAGTGGLMAGPVLAYALVALLAYPAYLGLRGAVSGSPRPTLLASPTGLESDVRDTSGIDPQAAGAAIRLTGQGTQAVVTIFAPIDDESYRYRLQVRDSSGDVVFEQANARSFDGVGTFALLLPAGALEPGAYELRLDEMDLDGDDVVNTFRFPFTTE